MFRKPGSLQCYLLQVFFFFNFWLSWVMIAVYRLSVIVMSEGYPLLQCMGFSLRWLLLLLSTSFSSCGMQVQ